MRRLLRAAAAWGVAALATFAPQAGAEELPEYRLKAAFVYNFVLFTEWPADVGATLNLCVHGKDPFGPELDPLQGKAVAGRTITVHRKAAVEMLKGCQVVFVAPAAIGALPRVLDSVRGVPVLTIADSPGATAQGVMLNMSLVQDKVTFAANLEAARAARLVLSSKLLRLATEVRP